MGSTQPLALGDSASPALPAGGSMQDSSARIGGIARFSFTSATSSVQILQQLLPGRDPVPVSLAADGREAYQGIGWLFRQPVSRWRGLEGGEARHG